ncbi:MAG: NAD(P)-dependent oxidoreductase [Chromatiales bacterium]|nr:NAD(P)-dependent oxidoreductase [Chromatiales bacterium]
MTKRVLVTGAAGVVAGYVLPRLAERHALRLLDRRPVGLDVPGERVAADITVFEQLLDACKGVDTVVHLAAEPSMHATFDAVLGPNIVGAYHVFEAAQRAGCARVVFASSINSVFAYPLSMSVTPDLPVNPLNVYGASKCFGEALARSYANRGLSALCVRIGKILAPGEAPPPPDDIYHQAWISARDLASVFDRCVAKESVDFAIVHALSRHANPRLSIESTCELLGYQPQDGTI